MQECTAFMNVKNSEKQFKIIDVNYQAIACDN